jgi:hypothetical protein
VLASHPAALLGQRRRSQPPHFCGSAKAKAPAVMTVSGSEQQAQEQEPPTRSEEGIRHRLAAVTLPHRIPEPTVEQHREAAEKIGVHRMDTLKDANTKFSQWRTLRQFVRTTEEVSLGIWLERWEPWIMGVAPPMMFATFWVIVSALLQHEVDVDSTTVTVADSKANITNGTAFAAPLVVDLRDQALQKAISESKDTAVFTSLSAAMSTILVVFAVRTMSFVLPDESQDCVCMSVGPPTRF